PVKEPMPVQPTAHYAMGGIPTNTDGEVLLDAQKTVLPGLYAAGEVACVSVHGANRLGTNSLTDLVVFGRRCGKEIAKYCDSAELLPLPADAAAASMAEFERIRKNTGGAKAFEIRKKMQSDMTEKVGVFRIQEPMDEAVAEMTALKKQWVDDLTIDDKGTIFNTDLLEAWELGNLLDIARVTAYSAASRPESRGGHARDDFKERDDENWLKHTLCHMDKDGNLTLSYKDVTLGRYEPKPRVY
ncbi:MAG TPA: FAD-binding protein, partial [Anaerolineae bacterium]|nr:FAD-binding protein [Anaerolineae bacterium]